MKFNTEKIINKHLLVESNKKNCVLEKNEMNDI